MIPRRRLTRRQSDALEAIRAHIEAHGWAPTCAELGAALGIHETSAHRLVLYLAARGAVRMIQGSPRAIAIVDDAAELVAA